MGDTREAIAKNIAYYRKLQGLSQVALAEKIGTRQSTVSTWERGENVPDADIIMAVCDALNISVADLYGEDTRFANRSSEIDSLVEAFHKNPKLGLLFSRSQKMKPEDLDAVLAIVERMKIEE